MVVFCVLIWWFILVCLCLCVNCLWVYWNFVCVVICWDVLVLMFVVDVVRFVRVMVWLKWRCIFCWIFMCCVISVKVNVIIVKCWRLSIKVKLFMKCWIWLLKRCVSFLMLYLYWCVSCKCWWMLVWCIFDWGSL